MFSVEIFSLKNIFQQNNLYSFSKKYFLYNAFLYLIMTSFNQVEKGIVGLIMTK